MQRKEGKKDGSKGKGGLSDPSQQQIYQAIVIATCDEDEFRSHDSSSPVVSDLHPSVFKKLLELRF